VQQAGAGKGDVGEAAGSARSGGVRRGIGSGAFAKGEENKAKKKKRDAEG